MSPLLEEGSELALVGAGQSGVTLVLASSPLTRLNYFDGKFLRAEHLRREQEYLRGLVRYANQGLGAGIVYGYSTTLAGGGKLSIGAGLAVDGGGRTLLLPDGETVEIGRLIGGGPQSKARPAPRPGEVLMAAGPSGFRPCEEIRGPGGPTVRAGMSLYLICVSHLEALCGEEDVFGRLCEQACVSASERPWIVEGVAVRALPLRLEVALAASRAVALDRRHLRSLVASAYYAQEWRDGGSLISGNGIRQRDTWCLGALGPTGSCVPLGVLAQRGAETIYFDAWTARRERMEAPARRYWAGIMRMRPWDAYLAQILQFQCQLHDLLGGGDDAAGQPADPCAEQGTVLKEAADVLNRLEGTYAGRFRAAASAASAAATAAEREALPEVTALKRKLSAAIATLALVPRDRVLINGGIVELPPAGYLPVVPGTLPVESQVRRYMGDGVDLRFCVVREDFVAHALEEAQHMERISLLTGLDDPARKPAVDILVPEGELEAVPAPAPTGYEARLVMSKGAATGPDVGVLGTSHGLAQTERRAAGGKAFHMAVVREAATIEAAEAAVATFRSVGRMGEDTVIRGTERATVRARERMEEAVHETFDGALAARMAGRVIEMHLRSAAEREAAIAGGPTPAAPPAAAPAPAGITTLGRRADAAFWGTMRIDGDIFAARVGDTLAADVENASVAISQQASAVQVTSMQGKLFVEQTGPTAGGGRRVVCRATGAQISRASVDGVLHEGDAPDPIDYRVELTREGTDDDGRTVARVRPATIPEGIEPEGIGFFEFDTTWANAASTVTTRMNVVTRRAENGETTERRLQILLVTLTRNPAAFAEGSPLRTATTAGVQLIEDGLVRAKAASAQYGDAALRKLFPPPPEAAKPSLKATRDWVLFHRRRTKECAVEVVVPVREPALRRYALIAINAHNLDNARRIAMLLAENIDRIGEVLAVSTRMPAKYITTIEFKEGASALETAVTELRTRWKAEVPGDAGISLMGGSDGAGEDDAVVLARASNTMAALSPLLVSDPATLIRVLRKVPLGVDLHGAEELMLAVIYPVARPQGRVVRIVVTNGVEPGIRSPRLTPAGAPQPLFWLSTDQEGVPTASVNAQAGALLPFLRDINGFNATISLAPAGAETADATRVRADHLLQALKAADVNLFGSTTSKGPSILHQNERDLVTPVGTMPEATDVLFLQVVEIN